MSELGKKIGGMFLHIEGNPIVKGVPQFQIDLMNEDGVSEEETTWAVVEESVLAYMKEYDKPFGPDQEEACREVNMPEHIIARIKAGGHGVSVKHAKSGGF